MPLRDSISHIANSATTMATRAAFTANPLPSRRLRSFVGTGLNSVEMISAAGARSFMTRRAWRGRGAS